MVIYVCLWPITPSFICSIFFYVCLYVSPIQLGKKFYNTVLGRRHWWSKTRVLVTWPLVQNVLFLFRHTGRFDYSLTECRQRPGVCLWSFRRWDCFDWSPWKNLIFLAFSQSRNPTQLPAALWALVQPHCPETPLLRPSWKSGNSGQERGVVHCKGLICRIILEEGRPLIRLGFHVSTETSQYFT